MKELDKETAISYFLKRAPKAMREKEITKIEELEHPKGFKAYLINEYYMVYVIKKQNNGFRNVNYSLQISGQKLTRNDRRIALEVYRITRVYLDLTD